MRKLENNGEVVLVGMQMRGGKLLVNIRASSQAVRDLSKAWGQAG